MKKIILTALALALLSAFVVSAWKARAPYKPGYGTVIVDKSGAAAWIISSSSMNLDENGETYSDLWEAERIAESLFGAQVPGVWSTSHSAKSHQFIPYDECIERHKKLVDEWLDDQ